MCKTKYSIEIDIRIIKKYKIYQNAWSMVY